MNKLQGKGGFIPRTPNRFGALSALVSDDDGDRFSTKGELSRRQRARAPQVPKGLENGNQDLSLLLKTQEIFRDAANARIELMNLATDCSLDSKSRKAAAIVEKSIEDEREDGDWDSRVFRRVVFPASSLWRVFCRPYLEWDPAGSGGPMGFGREDRWIFIFPSFAGSGFDSSLVGPCKIIVALFWLGSMGGRFVLVAPYFFEWAVLAVLGLECGF
ncbi:hypothetical protein U1Q18_040309 [Sarracenia purpurea var. burkii]